MQISKESNTSKFVLIFIRLSLVAISNKNLIQSITTKNFSNINAYWLISIIWPAICKKILASYNYDYLQSKDNFYTKVYTCYEKSYMIRYLASLHKNRNSFHFFFRKFCACFWRWNLRALFEMKKYIIKNETASWKEFIAKLNVKKKQILLVDQTN